MVKNKTIIILVAVVIAVGLLLYYLWKRGEIKKIEEEIEIAVDELEHKPIPISTISDDELLANRHNIYIVKAPVDDKEHFRYPNSYWRRRYYRPFLGSSYLYNTMRLWSPGYANGSGYQYYYRPSLHGNYMHYSGAWYRSPGPDGDSYYYIIPRKV